MAAKIRWKQDARHTGLARVGQGTRGFAFHDGDKTFMRVEPVEKHSFKTKWLWWMYPEHNHGKNGRSKARFDNSDDAKVAAENFFNTNKANYWPSL